jgi:hypothetical protein
LAAKEAFRELAQLQSQVTDEIMGRVFRQTDLTQPEAKLFRLAPKFLVIVDKAPTEIDKLCKHYPLQRTLALPYLSPITHNNSAWFDNVPTLKTHPHLLTDQTAINNMIRDARKSISAFIVPLYFNNTHIPSKSYPHPDEMQYQLRLATKPNEAGAIYGMGMKVSHVEIPASLIYSNDDLLTMRKPPSWVIYLTSPERSSDVQPLMDTDFGNPNAANYFLNGTEIYTSAYVVNFERLGKELAKLLILTDPRKRQTYIEAGRYLTNSTIANNDQLEPKPFSKINLPYALGTAEFIGMNIA